MYDGNFEWARRTFLSAVSGNAAAEEAFEELASLGMMSVPDPWVGSAEVSPSLGNGKSVVILGAGIGGLTAAYMLLSLGFDVRIFEAQDRAGGRNFTARKGTKVTEYQDGKEITQICNLDDGLYINLGPGRIPYHHRRVLSFCERLKVELEPYVMQTTANRYQNPMGFKGQPQPRRHIAADTRGYVSSLLAKAVLKGHLDHELKGEDKARLLNLLKTFGDLKDGTYDYEGSTRSGCAKRTDVHTPCEPTAKHTLSALLQAEFWKHNFYQPDELEWQDTLFQPVGGMDKIVERFLEDPRFRIKDRIQLSAPVLGIQLLPTSVSVEYLNPRTRLPAVHQADYCISTIPLPLLAAKIKTNFAPDFRQAVATCPFTPTCKVGWQAESRFWEKDGSQIYGGISYVNDQITQIWYPSDGMTSGGKTTLTGAYNYRDVAVAFGRLSPQERLNAARRQAARVHPEFEDDQFVPKAKGISIAWHQVPRQEGGWAGWQAGNPDHDRAYARLLQPDRRFHVVGDQVSHLPGWMEGAMMSAEHVVHQIVGLRTLAPSPDYQFKAPDSRRMTEGG